VPFPLVLANTPIPVSLLPCTPAPVTESPFTPGPLSVLLPWIAGVVLALSWWKVPCA
jgi:hypothetical protein